MRVYTARNYLTARSFMKEVSNYCENKPNFVVDKAPWLKRALESLGLKFEHETSRSLV
jgi:transposase-like protein